jgi:hypothetical protein
MITIINDSMLKNFQLLYKSYKNKLIHFSEELKGNRKLQIVTLGIVCIALTLTVYAIQQFADIRSRARVGNNDPFVITDQNGAQLAKNEEGRYKTTTLQVRINRGNLDSLIQQIAPPTEDTPPDACPEGYDCSNEEQKGILCSTIGTWCDPTPTPTPTYVSTLVAPPAYPSFASRPAPPLTPTPATAVSPTAGGRSTYIRSSHFGARVAFDGSFNMQRLRESGLGLIRYDLRDASVGSVNSAFAQDKLPALYSNNFYVMYVYNPGGEQSKSQIKTNLQNLLNNLKSLGGSDDDLEIEIGNEPNSKDFWHNGSTYQERLTSFAGFTKDTIDVLTEIAPHTEIVLGALDLQGIYYGGGTSADAQKVANFYAQALKEAGVNTDKYPIAVHVYHYAKDIDTVTDMMASAFKTSSDKFYYTEIGVDKSKADQKAELVPMLQKAYSMSKYRPRVYIHEFNGSSTWGIGNNGDDTSLYEDVRSYVLNFEFPGMAN